MLTIKVVFQGGGAKLVTLMAAASVLQDLESKGELRVQRVVGVSAGSIAACMLASQHPWDNLRLRTAEAGRTVVNRVDRMPSVLGALWKAYRGVPFLPEEALRDFCTAVFHGIQIQGQPLEHLGQLRIPTSIITSSVRHTEKTIIDSAREKDTHLVDALCDSCAIPLVFRTFTDKGFRVDGGLCGNLPDAEVLAGTDGAFVLGFGFESEVLPEPTGLLSYGGALVATAMNSAVRDSMARIRGGFGEVIELPQHFSTLDFKAAVESGLTDDCYRKVRDHVTPRVLGALRRFRDHIRTTEGETTLRRKFLDLYRQQTQRLPYFVHHSAMVVTANSARPTDDVAHDDDDATTHIVEYRPRDGEIACLKVGLVSGAAPPTSGESDYRVETMDGNVLPAVQVVTSEQRNGVQQFYALFFLNRPVSHPVRVIQRMRQRGAMRLLGSEGGREWLRFHNPSESDAPSVDLILWFPEHIGTVAMLDLKENVNLLHESRRPQHMDGQWTVGRSMTESELDPYKRELAPPGLKLVGWRTEKVKPTAHCGVIFQRT
jgi:predicted acylesterase/phospholipase RssA